MNKWIGVALFLSLALLFFIANRGANRGFFQADELDNLSWTPHIALTSFAADLVNPVYNARNFRPVGHLYFRIMANAFGLDFAKYILPLQLLHLFNVWLLWLVLRNLRASPFAAACAVLFFAFHMATFDVFWKPMYVFDLCCAAFCLLSLLCWIKGRWLLSFLAFWLAYKSKELAVMLPAVLACYELWFGQRRWRRLAPFFLVSLSFGLQGIFRNPNQNNDYTFHFTASALAVGAIFYAGELFGLPFLGFGLLALPAIRRDRRVWFGVAAAVLFLVPLVFLPGRLFSAYWYVPLIGVALALSSFAETRYGWLAAVFLAAWLPWNYLDLRDYRHQKLAQDADNEAYVNQLRAASPKLQAIPVFLYHGLPPTFSNWGVGGALHCLFPYTNAKLYPMEDIPTGLVSRNPILATLVWNQPSRKLWIAAHDAQTLDATYIIMNNVSPVWQLTGGWYGMENGFRWAAPVATARLYRAARATQFEVVLNVGPWLLPPAGYADYTVLLNGAPLETVRLTGLGIHVLRWPLPAGTPGTVQAEFRAGPSFHAGNDPRTLGAAVVSFGFLPSGR